MAHSSDKSSKPTKSRANGELAPDSAAAASRPAKRPASPVAADLDDGDDLVQDGGEDEQHTDDDGGDDDDEPEAESSAAASARRASKRAKTESGPNTKHAKSKAKSKSSRRTPGIVYISRLPPGMTPQKVRHLMDRWGEVGKVYAQRRDAPTGYNPNAASQKKQKQKHQRADFTEAWVEFLDKSIAKMVAQMLNAQVIGGKKGDRWRDDIWTMKYLSGFKWEMLSEQFAYEKQAHQARLRTEITRAKTEQGEYLRNVELARVLEKRKQKKLAAGAGAGTGSGTGSATGAGAGKGDAGAGAGAAAMSGDGPDRKAGYRQRQAVDRREAHKGAGMDDVLGSVFG